MHLNYWLTNFYIFFDIIFIAFFINVSAAGIPPSDPLSFILKTDTTDTLRWSPPRFQEGAEDRHKLVKSLDHRITDMHVLNAIRSVPRHLFIADKYQKLAYQNRPLPIGYDQTISQPFIVAYMTQLLDLKSGKKVLEIGTGSGYQAAVLAEITPKVYTIEIVEELGHQARARFDSLGYSVIQTKIGDGYTGWEKHAPFDAIILTAAPPKIPQPLIDQLGPGGILVAPVGSINGRQVITKLIKLDHGEIKREQKLPVRFVPMTGDAQNKY